MPEAAPSVRPATAGRGDIPLHADLVISFTGNYFSRVGNLYPDSHPDGIEEGDGKSGHADFLDVRGDKEHSFLAIRSEISGHSLCGIYPGDFVLDCFVYQPPQKTCLDCFLGTVGNKVNPQEHRVVPWRSRIEDLLERQGGKRHLEHCFSGRSRQAGIERIVIVGDGPRGFRENRKKGLDRALPDQDPLPALPDSEFLVGGENDLFSPGIFQPHSGNDVRPLFKILLHRRMRLRRTLPFARFSGFCYLYAGEPCRHHRHPEIQFPHVVTPCISSFRIGLVLPTTKEN